MGSPPPKWTVLTPIDHVCGAVLSPFEGSVEGYLDEIHPIRCFLNDEKPFLPDYGWYTVDECVSGSPLPSLTHNLICRLLWSGEVFFFFWCLCVQKSMDLSLRSSCWRSQFEGHCNLGSETTFMAGKWARGNAQGSGISAREDRMGLRTYARLVMSSPQDERGSEIQVKLRSVLLPLVSWVIRCVATVRFVPGFFYVRRMNSKIAICSILGFRV
jgi:hypothetical protein